MDKNILKSNGRKPTIALCCIFLMLVMINLMVISAADWDNKKTYEESTKQVTIKNSILGIIPTNEIAKVTLIDNTDYCITHCSATIKLELFIDHNKPFQKLDFYNSKAKKNKKTITNDIYLRTSTTEVEINDYTKVCSIFKTLSNGTQLENCNSVKTGSHTEERYEYEKYDGKKLDAGTYYFRIEGTKHPRENVEWIPTFMGLELDEYALWYSGLDAGLFAYYNFESGTGTTVVDRVNGTAQGTLTGTPVPTWHPGKVGAFGLQINGTTGYVNITNTTEINDAFGNRTIGNYTYNFWVNMTQGTALLGKGDGTNNENYWAFQLVEGGGSFYYQLYQYSSGGDNCWIHTLPRPETKNTTNFGNWTMVTLTKSDAGVGCGNYTVMVNNLTLSWDAINILNPKNNIFNANSSLFIGNKTGGNSGVGRNFTIDELGIWNRVLSNQEISDLYNNGTGITYNLGTPGVVVTLDSPVDNYGALRNGITFNASFLAGNGNLSNATLYVWRSNGTIFGINRTTDAASTGIYGATNFSNLSISGFDIASGYTWNYEACGNNSIGFKCATTVNRTFDYGFNLNNESFNVTVYETENTNFSINISYDTTVFTATDVTGNLWYDGTSHAGTRTVSGNDLIFDSRFDLPLVSSIENKTFNWEFIFGGADIVNSTTQVSSVNPINFTACTATNPITFVNFTFQDEGNLTQLEATIPTSSFTHWMGDGGVKKNFTFVNASENRNYTFCFNPRDRNVSVDYQIQYDRSGYQQRIADVETMFSNATTEQTLFMLSNADGIFVTFQVLNLADQPIESVFANATRTIGGVPTVITTGFTGADGGVTFWLNPNFQYTFTFEKTGFDIFTTSLFPTQTSYTIQLGGESTTEEGITDYWRGITIDTSPNTMLNPQTFYLFDMILQSKFWEVESFAFNLTNSSGFQVAYNGSALNGGIISYFASTRNDTLLIMNQSWVIGGNTTYRTTYWRVRNDTVGGNWSIRNFFDDLNDYSDTGMFGMDDFSTAIIMFLAIFVFTGILSFKFGLTSPAAISGALFTTLLFLDAGVGVLPNFMGATQAHFLTGLVGLVMVILIIKGGAR